MNARFILTAAALLSAAPAIAQPAMTEAAAQPQSRPVQVVMASAEQVGMPTAGQQANAPVKRARVARVTTCRCGDPQQAQEESN